MDLLIVGAGPTGIAIGAEARRAGLEPLLVERGARAANLLQVGQDLGKIFIENWRDHSVRIVRHLRRRLAAADPAVG